MKINSKLQDILNSKREELDNSKKIISPIELENSKYYTRKSVSLLQKINKENPFVIAEFKRNSPAKGLLNENAKIKELANGYQSAGASAISILTDLPFFKGTREDLISAREVSTLPLLRKDFIIDEYQILEAKSWGADLLLLIAAILSPAQIQEYSQLAKTLGLEVILEIHNPKELDNLDLGAISFLGVNNRDLETFITDYRHSLKILPDLPENLPKISESGISNPSVVAELFMASYQGFLIGEYFMRSQNPALTCQEFIQDIKTV